MAINLKWSLTESRKPSKSQMSTFFVAVWAKTAVNFMKKRTSMLLQVTPVLRLETKFSKVKEIFTIFVEIRPIVTAELIHRWLSRVSVLSFFNKSGWNFAQRRYKRYSLNQISHIARTILWVWEFVSQKKLILLSGHSLGSFCLLYSSWCRGRQCLP